MIDFDQPENNDWPAVNLFSVTENRHRRRPDAMPFVNGPSPVLEQAEGLSAEWAAACKAASNRCWRHRTGALCEEKKRGEDERGSPGVAVR